MNKKESISTCISAEQEIAKVVLMPGDPLRAQFIAEHYLEDAVLFNSVRNMLGYTGTYHGKQISVMGHGMGCPSMGLYAHELFTQFGVEAIIRIGSAGGLDEDVDLKDVVIAQAASSNSAYGNAFGIPGQLAACADFGLLEEAVKQAREKGSKIKVGKIYTSDFFYYPDASLDQKLQQFGHLAVDMETAGLYWEASACGKKALSLLSISNHILKGTSLSSIESQQGFTEMMEIALETGSSLEF